MKTTAYLLLLIVMPVALIGCNGAQDAIDGAKDMANIDFGDFDMDGLKDKMASVTSGLKDVTADNVDGVTEKISGLSSTLGSMDFSKLSGPAKTAVNTALNKFVDTIKSAMDNISDDSVLAKLKPVVEPLMEKIKSMTE